MIAADFQPFSIVEDRGFRAHTQALDPSYVLPSRSTISKQLLPNLFEKVKADLLEQIKAAPAVCLTTDCWTSNTTTSYMSVTCHYIGSDFKLKSNLLDCFVVTEQHTSENVAPVAAVSCSGIATSDTGGNASHTVSQTSSGSQ